MLHHSLHQSMQRPHIGLHTSTQQLRPLHIVRTTQPCTIRQWDVRRPRAAQHSKWHVQYTVHIHHARCDSPGINGCSYSSCCTTLPVTTHLQPTPPTPCPPAPSTTAPTHTCAPSRTRQLLDGLRRTYCSMLPGEQWVGCTLQQTPSMYHISTCLQCVWHYYPRYTLLISPPAFACHCLLS